MIKRLMMIATLLVGVFAMTTPTTVSIAARAYTEGIHFSVTSVGRCPHGAQAQTTIDVTATKNVDGKWRQSLVNFRLTRTNCPPPPQPPTIFEGTAPLTFDPDLVEVSNDLGWGGLQGNIVLFDPADGQNHTIGFFVSQFASESNYSEDPATGYFMRNATLEGWISKDGNPWFDLTTLGGIASSKSAYNFSDQWPGY